MLTEELRAAAQGFRFPGCLTDAEEIAPATSTAPGCSPLPSRGADTYCKS